MNLRALEEQDLKELKKWRNLDHIRKTVREFRLLNMVNQKNWFVSIHQTNPPQFIMFGIENKKGRLIGVVGLTYIDWKNRHSEISIFFSKKGWQKQQSAKNAINTIVNYGFGELNLHRLYVEIFEISEENINLFKNLGFKKEGLLREKLWRNGKWCDSFIYSILE